mmetsp:Transcript_21895/g.45610  ORF Transcript_21895/g.45610 Transcript_21895/m.45610 type:complete len:503 (-) Transcript_21895:32-1540(-)|eukprot:CAMPEP_0118645674 /NCGR_PEP_ID=MMETSP0785-20121206/7632_1 /TAXON_ID=91992 /ORGANISM="Bolidomonas pacifica, Strain CCMP 1866" /LENGTH=502 /DNA_ID=CAMNT_0006537583 /DNA_START=185 /DNA_END=1693 /DNA_ORIENTATION=+
MLEGLPEATEPASSSVNAEGRKGDEEEQMRQVNKMDKFGWGVTALVGITAGLNGLYAIRINHPFWHNSPVFGFLIVLHWSVCLDERSSLWSFRFTFLLAYLGVSVLPVFTVPYWHDAHDRFGSEVLIFDIVSCFINAIAFIAFYHTFMVARRALQKQYGRKTIDASVKIALQVAVSLPYISFLVVNMIGSGSSLMEEAKTYASHTPFCKYTPDELSNYNNEYQCEVFGDEMWERGDPLGAHTLLGISTLPVFTSPTTFLNLTESIKAVETFGDPTTTNTTVLLTHKDFVRIFAQHNYQAAVQDYLTYLIQGIVFDAVLFVAQIYSRVTRASFDDVLSFNITKLETFIVLNTFAMVMVSMYISSLNGKSLSQQFYPITYFIQLLIPTLFVAIYILCKKVVNDKSQIVLHRPRRASAVSVHRVLPSSSAPAATSHVEELQSELTDLKSTVHDQSTKMEDMQRMLVSLQAKVKSTVHDQSTKMEEMQRMLMSLQAKVDDLTAPSP